MFSVVISHFKLLISLYDIGNGLECPRESYGHPLSCCLNEECHCAGPRSSAWYCLPLVGPSCPVEPASLVQLWARLHRWNKGYIDATTHKAGPRAGSGPPLSSGVGAATAA